MNTDDSTLIRAVCQGEAETVKVLLTKSADANVKDENGSPVLLLAAFYGHSEIARLLSSAGAEVNLRNQYGSTALMAAADEGHIEIVEALLAKGADVNAKNKDGMTALLFAAQACRTRIVNVLLNNGADISTENKDGMTAHTLAVLQKCDKTVEALLNRGAEEPSFPNRNDEEGIIEQGGISQDDPHVMAAIALSTWLSGSTFREHRRFLEARPELPASLSDYLSDLITQHGEISLDAETSKVLAQARECLNLLRDIRARGSDVTAIRQGYINFYGGFALDIPSWLEEVESQVHELEHTDRPDQTAAHAALLRKAIARAERVADVAPETIATLKILLWKACWNITDANTRQNQEEGITCLLEARQIYTLANYPYQYAGVQNNLGLVFSDRIEGDYRTNVEDAITCYQEALRVFTFEIFPVQYAAAQNNLGMAYWNRIEGKRQANMENAIHCYQGALRVFTFEAFPMQYAQTQSGLGNTYRDRIEGKRQENLEQAIAHYQEALRVFTFEAFPMQYALTQKNLGTAYTQRIAGEPRENLEQAIAHYQEALHVFTFEAFPMQYALTQSKLGNTYRDRIEGKRQENLEQAIAHYQEASRVFTFEAFPHDYREMQLNRALAEAQLHHWAGVHEAYSSAVAAEDSLVALAAGVTGHDVVLREGRDATVREGFALVRLGRFPEAAVVLERGRARGLAEALALEAANPARISDAARRARYQGAREQFVAAQIALNASSDAELPRMKAYQEAKTAFNRVVDEIHAANDPANFLVTSQDPTMILRAAEGCGQGHALVYLAATPWGGMAVIALANTTIPTEDRFAAFDLPLLTDALVNELIGGEWQNDEYQSIGGFGHAQEGNGFALIWKGWTGTLFQELRYVDSGTFLILVDRHATFREQATTFHTTCMAKGKSSTLDQAAQKMLDIAELADLIDQPLGQLSANDQSMLNARLGEIFLRLELERCLRRLAHALQPLTAWLGEQRKQGATGVTFIPCGMLATFPLAAVEVAPGQTIGDLLPTSIAPSGRSLLHESPIASHRSGIYALGDPEPTHRPLRWSEAEAHTVAKLARSLNLPAEARVQQGARRGWLINALQHGSVVDASCHGSFNGQDVLQSALLLAQGKTLTLGEMLSHKVDLRGLRLLILSACQTAILDLRGAYNEVRSLAAGMLQAGADAVMAALWPVDDKATYLLIVRFAQEWFPCMEYEPPAAALGRAQHWLRTVTNRKLREWDTTMLPIPTLQERYKVDPNVAASNLWEEEIHEHANIGKLVKVRWRGNRYGADKAESLTRAVAERRGDPDACPYEDPFYWAGFQITGW